MFMTKKRHEAELRAANMRADEAGRVSRTKGRFAAEMMAERDRAYAKLRQIAAMETPSAAHAAKRMAAVARDALPRHDA